MTYQDACTRIRQHSIDTTAAAMNLQEFHDRVVLDFAHAEPSHRFKSRFTAAEDTPCSNFPLGEQAIYLLRQWGHI